MTKHTSVSGQVVLITLLVLTIATTIALSLISRSTTDTTITTQTQESSQAFSAAEAGIEEALKSGSSTAGPTGIVGAADTTYAVNVASIGGGTGVYPFIKKTLEGTTETLWLIDHDPNTDLPVIGAPVYTGSSMDICWSSESTTPALIVTLIYKESSDGSIRMAKAAFDPNGTRATTNKFSAPTSLTGGCGAGTGTTYKETLTFSSMNALAAPNSIAPGSDTLIALRFRPVYSDTNIVVNSASTIPKQGSRIDSTGSAGDTNRKIVVYKQYRSPSGIFDAAVYSENNFVQ